MKISSGENTGGIKKWMVYLLVLLTLGLFAWLAVHVKSGGTFLIDDEAFAATFAMRNNSMTLLMRAFTFLGSSYFLLPANILLICWILLSKKNRLLAMQWAITAIGSLLLMYFFKGFYGRQRPLDPFLEAASGFSFPSGHTLNSLVFFGLFIFILWKFAGNKYWKLWGAVLLSLLILGIGLSRIYLRVHYASDVLGGLALGVAWLTLSIYVFERLKKVNIDQNVYNNSLETEEIKNGKL